MKKSFYIPALCIAGCLFIGYAGSFPTAIGLQNWYPFIQKPSFTPPNYLFGPVWTLLYILMGISLSLIIQNTKKNTTALIIFCAQLLLNFLWSFLFFYWQNIKLAFTEIVILWFFIAWMIGVFYKINKTAALLNIPYLLWVGFASVLTGSIYYLN